MHFGGIQNVATEKSKKAVTAADKIEIGRKYLSELNYTEAVASFTEAIKLDPENILAYMGRAEAYVALKQYDDAKADYTTAIEKTAEQPYTQAEAYIGRAEVNELTTANETAWADMSEAENGTVTAEALTAAAPTAEEIGAVSLSKLYVYYGSHENRSREGEGVWFILNPGKKDLTA